MIDDFTSTKEYGVWHHAVRNMALEVNLNPLKLVVAKKIYFSIRTGKNSVLSEGNHIF